MSVNTLIDSPTEIDPADSGSGLSVAKDYVYDVDGVTYYSDRRKLTGAEIMAAAKIPLSRRACSVFSPMARLPQSHPMRRSTSNPM